MINLKNNNGITLIVLVVTIIILVILAGVSIVSILGNNSFITKSSDSSFSSKIANFKEELNLYISSKTTENHGNYDKSTLFAKNIVSQENGILPITTVIPSITNDNYCLSRIEIQKGEFIFYNFTDHEFELINSIISSSSSSSNEKNFKQQDGVNPPVIPSEDGLLSTKEGSGICGVTFSDSDTPILYSDFSKDWYNYSIQSSSTENGGTSNWANIETKDGSLWVWIPRFAYRISNFHKSTVGTVEIKFLNGTSNNFMDGSGSAETDPLKITYTNNKQNEWFIPPAFSFGGTNLTGFWFAKYEASSTNGNPHNTLASQSLQIKANCDSWTSIDLANSFGNCFYMGRDNANIYGFKNDTNTHLTKNSEWASVCFLTQSVYGRNGTPISINSTLKAGSNGPLCSTTGNYSGIFDMVGGASDTISAFTQNANIDLSNFISDSTLASNYYDLYTDYGSTQKTKGDAIWETSNAYYNNNSWLSSSSWFIQNSVNSESRMVRGGDYSNSTSGIFGFNRFSSAAYKLKNVGFRPTITL